MEKLVKAKVQYLVERLKAIKESKVNVFEFQNSQSANIYKVKSSSNQKTQMYNESINTKKENLFPDYRIKLTKNAISLNMDIPSFRKVEKKDFNTLYSEEKTMSLTLRKGKLNSMNKNDPVVLPFDKSCSKVVQVRNDTIISLESEIPNDNNNIIEELDSNNKRTILKKIILEYNDKKYNNAETKSKRTGSEIKSKGKFENLKNEDKKDFSLTFQNYFPKKKNKIEKVTTKKSSFSRKDIHVIDFNNLFDNEAKTERNFNSILSQNNNSIYNPERNALTSRNEKRLAPAKMIKIKQNAAKKKRYKSSISMKIEEKLINHMKIVKLSKQGYS